MSRNQHLVSRAKINLFLEVRGKREDGFHELDTVFCEVDWGDDIDFRLVDRSKPRVHFECDDPSVPTGPDNLIVKALRPWVKKQSRDIRIGLTKRLPMGGGLGGGSSNAAAVLRAIARVCSLDPINGDLSAWALELGSDVPFFLEGDCQRGRGRGEKLSALPVPDLDLVLVTPGVHCPTGKVFQSLSGDFSEPRDPGELIAALKNGQPNLIAKALYNRLEAPAFEIWPELKGIRDDLLAMGCVGALLSGSGSSVYGVAGDRSSAQDIASKMKNARALKTYQRKADDL